METKEIIKHLGGVQRVAKALGLNYMTVWQWQTRGRIPASYCMEIERVWHGAITAEEIRPDIFK